MEPVSKKEKPKALDDAASLEIVSLSKISSMKLAFDHMEIIKKSRILDEKI